MNNIRGAVLDFVKAAFCELFELSDDEAAVSMDAAGNIAIVCKPKAAMKTVSMTVDCGEPETAGKNERG